MDKTVGGLGSHEKKGTKDFIKLHLNSLCLRSFFDTGGINAAAGSSRGS